MLFEAQDTRLKIEIEWFDCLACLGYNLKRNFGHGRLNFRHRQEKLSLGTRELNFSPNWLNEDLRTEAKVPIVPHGRARVLYDSPYLAVTGASESSVLAM